MKTIKTRNKGETVRLTKEALEHYGKQLSGDMKIVHIATAYMPAKEFYSKGSPQGFHPGFDDSAGCALYDLEGCSFSVYEWELVK